MSSGARLREMAEHMERVGLAIEVGSGIEQVLVCELALASDVKKMELALANSGGREMGLALASVVKKVGWGMRVGLGGGDKS